MGTVAAVPLALGASSCGYILYPGRRGRTGGQIDIPVLIIDLLWFIPGLIPGIVCLVVDFSSGCIYRGGGSRAAKDQQPGELPHGTQALIAVGEDVVATGAVGADRQAELAWNQSVETEIVREQGRLVVRRADGAVASANISELL